jgi:hypothetical protein
MLAEPRALLASASMSIGLRIFLLTTGWILPLGWTVVWGVFRGAYAMEHRVGDHGLDRRSVLLSGFRIRPLLDGGTLGGA